MADGLDVVTIGIKDKGAIVILMIMRPQARFAIVTASCGDGCGIEFIDDFPAFRGKSNMRSR